MHTIFVCIRDAHDVRLTILAGLVCAVGVYATAAVGAHAGRMTGGDHRRWAIISVVTAGATAWATHFIALLAFQPGMDAAFEPVLTAISLLAAIVIIGGGLALGFRGRGATQRFLAGLVIGLGIGALHYIGQAAYRVVGDVSWDLALAIPTLLAGIGLTGVATVVIGCRQPLVRRAGPPLFLLAIATLHFGGMAAVTITFDPRRALPADAIPPEFIAPLVAGICICLLGVAIAGFKFSLDARLRLNQDRLRMREMADLALEGLIICEGAMVVAVNGSLERLSGFPKAALEGRPASALLPGIDLSALPKMEELEAALLGADGQHIPVRVLRGEVPVGSRSSTVFAIRDQRERLRTESQIRNLAYNDPLTGLRNRQNFIEVLEAHAASCRERGQGYAVLVIDLDRFKPVNDMYGHAAGDLLLRKVADRLGAAVADGDLVARLGGDEFAVLQVDAADEAGTTAFANRCIAALSRPFALDEDIVHIGASIGVASAPAQGYDPEELLRCADLALYAAKADGRGVSRFYQPELDERLRGRRLLEAGLRDALEIGGLVLHYQPLLDSRTRRTVAAEALVRWCHPERGLIAPADFIPLAEESGLIVPIGEWVLRTACRQAARWPIELSVAVNLSPVQFRDPHLADKVEAALASSGLDPARLELEITEGVLLSDEKRTLTTLNAIRARGIRISMDDFGTGYSSLSYLRRFPFDKIKVDQSFIRQLPADPESAAIVRAILTMGACLGIATTVEGVETPEQLAFTAAEGCDYIQGYLVSRPLPAEAFEAFLADEALASARLFPEEARAA